MPLLGLPADTRACLFDLDGVLTRTATVHAAAWKKTFDEFLQARAAATGEPFVPFSARDYDAYVDGKPRVDGTESFLTSRGITLPVGAVDDPPTAPTLWGVSNRKNQLVLAQLAAGRVEVYPGSVRYVHAARRAGLQTAVVSSSANAAAVLIGAGIADLFDARVDGVTAREQQLAGKPAPDMFLAGAQAVGVTPDQAVVFEDALAGVAAGRAGNFSLVVGVDRVGQAVELRKHGADVVVTDLAELLDASAAGAKEVR